MRSDPVGHAPAPALGGEVEASAAKTVTVVLVLTRTGGGARGWETETPPPLQNDILGGEFGGGYFTLREKNTRYSSRQAKALLRAGVGTKPVQSLKHRDQI